MNTDHLSPEFQESLSQDPVKRHAFQILADNLDKQQWKRLPADIVPAIVDAMLQFGGVRINLNCDECVHKEERTNVEPCISCKHIIIESKKMVRTNFKAK